MLNLAITAGIIAPTPRKALPSMPKNPKNTRLFFYSFFTWTKMLLVQPSSSLTKTSFLSV